MKRQATRFLYLLLSFMFLATTVAGFSSPVPANASTPTPLYTLQAGDTVAFAGQTWIVLNPTTGYLLMEGAYGSDRDFDSDDTNTFDPTDLDNIAYYLNSPTVSGGVYAGFSSADRALIKTHAWTIGGDDNESSPTVDAKIGLISLGEYTEYQALIEKSPLISDIWWTRTPYSDGTNMVWYVHSDGSLSRDLANSNYAVRPALYLNPDILVSGGNGGTVTTALGPPAAPTINPEGGTVFVTPQTVTVTNKTANGDAVYYTTDGTDPTLSDPYTRTFPGLSTGNGQGRRLRQRLRLE